MAERRVSLIVHDVPADVLAAVEADCERLDTSVTNVVGGVLAARLDVGWPGSKYPFRGIRGGSTWVIRVPEELRARLKEHADQTESAVGRLIVALLAEHYGLPIPPTRTQRGASTPREPRT